MGRRRPGKKRNGMAGIGSWLRTDEDGVVRAGAARGKYDVRLAAGDWNEERTIAVTSDKPIDAVFHRPWVRPTPGHRPTVERRQTVRTVGRTDVPRLVAARWVSAPPSSNPRSSPTARSRPRSTRRTSRCSSAIPTNGGAVPSSSARRTPPRTVNLVAMATYGGTVLDEDGKPLAGQTLNLHLKTAGPEPIATQQTDPSGRFRFAAVPAMIPLSVEHRRTRDAVRSITSPAAIAISTRARSGRTTRSGPSRRQSPAQVARRSSPPAPLTGRIENTCRNIRGSGMHALVLLQGDESRNVVALADQLLDLRPLPAHPEISARARGVEGAQARGGDPQEARLAHPRAGTGRARGTGRRSTNARDHDDRGRSAGRRAGPRRRVPEAAQPADRATPAPV